MTPEQDIIAGCIAAIEALQTTGSASLSFNHMQILMYIFLNDGISRKELRERISISSKEVIQRHTKDLLYGHGYISETESDLDSRYKHLHLTEEGYNVIITVVRKMQDCATCLKPGYKPDARINLFADDEVH
jgi:DNA-binding MarR family transcriptional regulator